MLKTIEQYISEDGTTVEIIQTSHSGPDYHVRYGLQVKHFNMYSAALREFLACCDHARNCCGLTD